MNSRTTLVRIAAVAGLALVVSGCSSSDDEPAAEETTVASLEAVDDSTDMPNVVILDGGGTITSTAVGPAEYTEYGGDGVPNGIVDILDRIQPEIAEVADITIVDGAIPGSSARTLTRELFDMTGQLDEILADDAVDAVVVNTGTNIMEEIAYWADLTVQSEKPVVFTGSMRQSNTFSFDGEANLFNAIRLAASQETYCYGTVMLMADEYFAAREVTKTDAWRPDTFSGGRYGALGTIDGSNQRHMRAPGRVEACGTDEWFTPFDLSTVEFEDLASAEIVFSYVEASPVPIEALVEAGVDGIVTAGHGAGGISSTQAEAREAGVDDGTVFVSTTRTGSGSIYDTGEPDVIGGLDLTPQKARVLLQLALTFAEDTEQVRDWFQTVGNPEFSYSPSE
ncbi:asparaginase domain-containing protein [Demequina aestuarii]|uniref:asparaginase domain-containing protein n=1 Tax=Demequina aestuarii TaxID=327095 RepID=UPI000785121D|nr:asparaginase domain-containing protein [Demequina aestuarii]